MPEIQEVTLRMIEHENGEAKRVHHFLKVYSFAQIIASDEKLDPEMQKLIEVAALMHDIGIRSSLAKYSSAAGPYQEKEGPPLARPILERLGFSPDFTNRVCWLIGHHHTMDPIEGVDHQILIEADFLVNALESEMPASAIESFGRRHFKTKAGRYMLQQLYAF